MPEPGDGLLSTTIAALSSRARNVLEKVLITLE